MFYNCTMIEKLYNPKKSIKATARKGDAHRDFSTYKDIRRWMSKCHFNPNDQLHVVDALVERKKGKYEICSDMCGYWMVEVM
jgi:hypothetical protein